MEKIDTLQVTTNPNYQVYARLRPIDYLQSIINHDQTQIQIKEINKSGKQSGEKITFNFKEIFGENDTQEIIFDKICTNSLTSVLEGKNACIISYGQTSSGKTYTIFGEDEKYTSGNYSATDNVDRRGLVPRCVEFLLKRGVELESQRIFSINCSIIEIYMDRVRDLGKAKMNENIATGQLSQQQLLTNYDNENLEITETQAGISQIRNLCTMQIQNMADLNDILQSAFSLRHKLETATNQLSARSHTIFTVNLVQKQVDNENVPYLNSSFSFVDLAGSERIAKSLAEGHKFQEALLINQNLQALQKCLFAVAQCSTKNMKYKESKLTKVLQSSLTSIALVSLIAHLLPGNSNHEECLMTLQYSDRTKCLDYKAKGGSQGRLTQDASTSNQMQNNAMQLQETFQSDAVLKKLNDDLADLKGKIENAQKEFKQNLQELQKLLQIDVDLEKMLSRPSDKDLRSIRTQREALTELQNLTELKRDMEAKLRKLNTQVDQQEAEQNKQLEITKAQVKKLKEANAKLKDGINAKKLSFDDELQKLDHDRHSELLTLITQSNKHMESQAHFILNRQHILQQKQEQFSKEETQKHGSILEAEREFMQQFELLKMEGIQQQKNLSQQFKQLSLKREQEFIKYQSDVQDVMQKKKQKVEQMRNELLDLYQIAQKQLQTINKAEEGYYSKGIKSLNVRQKDKPLFPNKEKHKQVQKLLQQRHMLRSQKETDNEYKNKIRHEYTQDAMRSLNNAKTGNKQENNMVYAKETKEDRLINSSNKVQSDQSVPLPMKRIHEIADKIDTKYINQKMSEKDLRDYADKLKLALKDQLGIAAQQRDKQNRLTDIVTNIDIEQIKGEVHHLKEQYLAEWKKNSQTRILLESQKRLINSPVVRSQGELFFKHVQGSQLQLLQQEGHTRQSASQGAFFSAQEQNRKKKISQNQFSNAHQ